MGKELQMIVETDEMIRFRLNRKDRVQGLREMNEHELTRSKFQLERSKSPTKF